MIVRASSARLDTTNGEHSLQSNFAAMFAINLLEAAFSVDRWYWPSIDSRVM
jgi:hypothetical protein